MVIALKPSTTTAITYTNCCGALLIMVEEYAMKIEHIFYLKENQDLTTEQRNTLIQNVLAEMKKEAMRIGHRKGVSICKNALYGLENANSSTY